MSKTRTVTLGLVAWAVLLTAASPALAQSTTCLGIEVTSIPAGSPMDSRDFSVSRILDLSFRVVFTTGSVFGAEETIELRIINPNGHLYQSLVVPVAEPMTGKRPEAERKLAGYPFPVKVSLVRNGKSRSADKSERGKAIRFVDAPSLPVGGTQISTNSLYGRWRVEAWQGGTEAACSTPFVLKQ